jgi:hypothetical protein
VARTFEIALPRELSPEQRLDLAADLRAAFFDPYPQSWAVHNPIDPDGGEHPHLHVMLSERRDDGLPRTPKVYFSRTATRTQDPAAHGVRKDRSFHGHAQLLCLRAGIATLVNASLERAGLDVAMTHESLKTQMSPRAPAVYTRKADKARVEALRAELQREDYHHENRINVAMWHFQKGQEGIEDISREAMVAHVRERFWGTEEPPGHAQTPARTVGDTQTLSDLGLAAVEEARTQGEAALARAVQEYHRHRGESWGSLREELDALLARMQGREEDGQGAGVRVRLWGTEEAQRRERGMGW